MQLNFALLLNYFLLFGKGLDNTSWKSSDVMLPLVAALTDDDPATTSFIWLYAKDRTSGFSIAPPKDLCLLKYCSNGSWLSLALSKYDSGSSVSRDFPISMNDLTGIKILNA